MTKAEKIICDYAYKFVLDKWDKINLAKVSITETKLELANKCFSNFDDAMWVLTEVAFWGMDHDYFEDYSISLPDDNDFIVFNIGGIFIKLINDEKYTYHAEIVEQKTRTVTYFD